MKKIDAKTSAKSLLDTMPGDGDGPPYTYSIAPVIDGGWGYHPNGQKVTDETAAFFSVCRITRKGMWFHLEDLPTRQEAEAYLEAWKAKHESRPSA